MCHRFSLGILLKIWLLGLISMVSCSGWANDLGTADEAQRMVEAALARVKAVGPEKAFAEFSAPGSKDTWHHKDVYLFCYRLTGENVCHGANRALIGQNLLDLRTPENQPIIRQMAELAIKDGQGWVTYKWPHPVTKKIATKRAYVARIPGYDGFIGAGIYH